MTFRQKMWVGVIVTLAVVGLSTMLSSCGGQKPPTLPSALVVADSDVIAIKGKALVFLEDLQTATIAARLVTDEFYTTSHQSTVAIDQMHGWFRGANIAILDATRKVNAMLNPTWAKLRAVLDPVFTAIQPIYAYAISSADHKHSLGDWLGVIGGAFITLLQIYGTATGGI